MVECNVMRLIGVTAGLGVVLGCTSSTVFICSDDADCNKGRCEPTGYCSFQTSNCKTGWVYGEFAAPHLAGTCVGNSTIDTDPGSTGEPSPTSDRATSDDPTTPPHDTASTSTTDPDTTFGYDTEIDPVDYACAYYANHVADCYDVEQAEGFYQFCVEAYAEYYAQSYACGYAFADYLVCLSYLDCGQMGDPQGVCVEELSTFSQACSLG